MPSIQASRDIARSNPSPGHARQSPLIDDLDDNFVVLNELLATVRWTAFNVICITIWHALARLSSLARTVRCFDELHAGRDRCNEPPILIRASR